MYGELSLVESDDGTYDLLIQYSRSHGEFGLDFMFREGVSEGCDTVSDYLTRFAKGLKVRSAKIMIGGLVVLALPITTMLQSAAASPRYSMAYLYEGNQSQQVDDAALAQGALDTVSPNYFDLNSNGSLQFNRPTSSNLEELQAMGVAVVPFLSNHWDRQAGINALANAGELTDQLAAHIEEYDLDGINADLENLTPAYRDSYTDFVAMLREKIPGDKEVSVAVAANPKGWTTGWHGSYDYAGLAEYADCLVLMTYDEHYEGSEPGPVASIDFVEDSIRYALKQVDPDQVVVGLPFYGRIWGADDYFQGQGVPLNQVEQLIRLYDATVLYDEFAQSPVATFTIEEGDPTSDINGRTLRPGDYQIWFENDQSILAKLALVDEYSLKGASIWALGQQTDSVWEAYESWVNDYDYLPEE